MVGQNCRNHLLYQLENNLPNSQSRLKRNATDDTQRNEVGIGRGVPLALIVAVIIFIWRGRVDDDYGAAIPIADVFTII